jgi:hypothetical protein
MATRLVTIGKFRRNSEERKNQSGAECREAPRMAPRQSEQTHRVGWYSPETEQEVSKAPSDRPTERVTETADAAVQVYHPELILCLCAAVGTDTKEVTEAFASELKTVGYTPVPIRLSQLMPQIPGLEFLADLVEEDQRIRMSMRAGNEIRRLIKNADAVIRLALPEIQNCRRSVNGDPDVQAERHCFIISSLKREEELETLRRLYGQRVRWLRFMSPAKSAAKISVAILLKASAPQSQRITAKRPMTLLILTKKKNPTNLASV